MNDPSRPGPGRMRGVARSAALIAVLTVLARAVGFGRIFAFSGLVGGGGCLGTAYATANQVPTVLFEVAAGGALAGAVVPVLAGLLARVARQELARTVSALLCWTVVVLAPLSLALALAAGPLFSALSAQSPGDALTQQCPGGARLGARMLVVFAPQVLLYGVGIVLTGVLQAHRRFIGPALAPLLSSTTVIGCYLVYGLLAHGHQHHLTWLPGRGPELVLTLGTTLGVAALGLPLLWPVLRTGVRLRPTLHFPPGVARQVTVLAMAGLATLLAQQAAVVATLAVATRVGGPGALNVVQFAQTVYLLPYAVLAVPLATAAFPRLSELAARADREAFATLTAATTRVVVLVSGLGAAGLVAVAPAAQALFLGLDAVGGSAFREMAACVTILAPGLVGWGLIAHLGRALYAQGRGRRAALATALGWLVVVVASVGGVVLLRAAGIDGVRAAVLGLAAGNTLGMVVGAAALVVAVRTVSGPAAIDGLGRVVAASVAAGVVAAAAGRFVAHALVGRVPAPGVRSLPAAVLAAAASGAGALLVAVVAFGAVIALLARAELSGLLRRVGRGRPGGEPGSPGRRAGSRKHSTGQGHPGASGVTRDGWPDEVLLVMADSQGGIGRHVAVLAEDLRAAGVPVRVAAPRASAAPLGLDRSGGDYLVLPPRGWRRLVTGLPAAVRLRRACRESAVVHAHGVRAGALTMLVAWRRPGGEGRPRRVVTVHNGPGPSPVAAVSYAVLARIVWARADVVLAVSADLAERARRGGARQVVFALVPPPGARGGSGPEDAANGGNPQPEDAGSGKDVGVPARTTGDSTPGGRGEGTTDGCADGTAHELAATAARTRAGLGVGPEDLLLVTVARLAPQKGLTELVEAVRLLGERQDVPELRVRAVVAGQGPLETRLSALIDAGRVPVRLLGERRDVPDLLAAADLVVLPSRWEGQPLVLQEALHLGTAIVATAVGGVPDLVRDAAELVPPGRPDLLADAVLRLGRSPELRASLRRRARARSRQLPGRAEALAQVLQVYRREPTACRDERVLSG